MLLEALLPYTLKFLYAKWTRSSKLSKASHTSHTVEYIKRAFFDYEVKTESWFGRLGYCLMIGITFGGIVPLINILVVIFMVGFYFTQRNMLLDMSKVPYRISDQSIRTTIRACCIAVIFRLVLSLLMLTDVSVYPYAVQSSATGLKIQDLIVST